MLPRAVEGQVVYLDEAPTPLGAVPVAATITAHSGMAAGLNRVYGSYAMTFVVRGSGTYRDAHHAPRAIGSGAVVLVFPELAHNYRPNPGTVWDEAYFVFEGPVFVTLREAGLFSPQQPVIEPPGMEKWLAALQGVLTAPYPASAPGRLLRVARFAATLTEMLIEAGPRPAAAVDPIAEARQILGAELGQPMSARDVARKLGLPYETFRKRFAQATGRSPMRYRLERRVQAASELLRDTNLTCAQVAEAIGFSDEFTFSRGFKALRGVSPRSFRRGGMPVEP